MVNDKNVVFLLLAPHPHLVFSVLNAPFSLSMDQLLCRRDKGHSCPMDWPDQSSPTFGHTLCLWLGSGHSCPGRKTSPKSCHCSQAQLMGPEHLGLPNAPNLATQIWQPIHGFGVEVERVRTLDL